MESRCVLTKDRITHHRLSDRRDAHLVRLSSAAFAQERLIGEQVAYECPDGELLVLVFGWKADGRWDASGARGQKENSFETQSPEIIIHSCVAPIILLMEKV